MHPQTLKRLAQHLASREEAIVDKWWNEVSADSEVGVGTLDRLTRREFKDNFHEILESLRDVLLGEPVEQLSARGFTEHGRERWKQSFSLVEFVRDWGHLHAVLIRECRNFYRREEESGEALGEALVRLAAFVTESMGRSVREYERLHQLEAASTFQDLKQLQEREQLLVEQRTRSLLEYAHDMRGSLMAIAGAGSAITPEMAEGEIRQLTEALDEGVQAISSMLGKLLELSRLEAGLEKIRPRQVQVSELARELEGLLRPVTERKSLELRVPERNDLLVETDPEMLKRILQNLLVNAIKYTSSGFVALSWEPCDAHRWTIVVEDSGPGIQSESGSFITQQLNDLPAARDPAEAVSSNKDALAWPGEGVGLSIVKRLCLLLDISIGVESTPGEGTRFQLTAPREYPGRESES